MSGADAPRLIAVRVVRSLRSQAPRTSTSSGVALRDRWEKSARGDSGIDEQVFESQVLPGLLGATGGSRPGLDVRPEPDVSVAEEGDGFGEILVTSAPVVDDLWSLDVEATCDPGGIHQVVDVHLSSHPVDGTRGVSLSW